VKKCREKEAKKRNQNNKQARACLEEQTASGNAHPKQDERDRQAHRPQQVLRRAQAAQEERKQQRQARREERMREQEHKRERRLRTKEERLQERLERLRWHEEIKHERELRLAYRQKRMASLAAAPVAQSSAVSTIFTASQTLVSLPKPT
jgi:hypothetical protein